MGSEKKTLDVKLGARYGDGVTLRGTISLAVREAVRRSAAALKHNVIHKRGCSMCEAKQRILAQIGK